MIYSVNALINFAYKTTTNLATVCYSRPTSMFNTVFKNRSNKVIFESFVFYIICNILHAHDYLIITHPVKNDETPRNC